MARRSKKSLRIGWLVLVGLVAVGGAGAVKYISATRPEKSVHSSQSTSTVVELDQQVHVSQAPRPSRRVTIYLPEYVHNDVYLTPVTRTTKAKGDILDAAMEALISASAKGGAEGLIPPGTRLLSSITVNNGIATVNFSKEFVDNFSGGSDSEALTLNSIAHTLVYYKDKGVRKVQILVEGKTVETLGGHFELTDPITADSTLLAPGN